MSQVTLFFCAVIFLFSSCKSRDEAQLTSEDAGTEVFTLKGHRVFRFVCVGGEVPPNCKDWDFQELDELLEGHPDYASYKIVAPALRDIESATKDIANVKAAMEKETRPFQKKGMQARIDVQEAAILKLEEVVKKNPKGEELYGVVEEVRGKFVKELGGMGEFRLQDWSRYLDSGAHHTCALSVGLANPKCWGDNDSGQTGGHKEKVKPEMLPLRMISTGLVHSCALTNKSMPICWGDNHSGQTEGYKENLKAEMLPMKMIASGIEHICTLTNRGEPICWGNEGYGRTEGYKEKVKAEMLPLKMISTGHEHTCALTNKGEPICWGDNGYGQTEDHKEKVKPEMLPLKMIASGRVHTCALTNKGEPICWGDNGYGQAEGYKEKVKPEMLPLKVISSHCVHTCVLTNKGEPICWGRNDEGQTEGYKENVKLEMLPLKMISAGGEHTCALTALGKPACWGYDGFGKVTGRSPEGYKLGLNVPEDVDLSFEAFYYGDN